MGIIYTLSESRRMTESTESRVPLPVRHALAALEVLRTEDAALAHAVQKVLPGYAKEMHRRGEEVSVENLLAAARLGAQYLKDASRPHKPDNFMSAYQSIAERFAAAHHAEQSKLEKLLRATREEGKNPQAALNMMLVDCAELGLTNLVQYSLSQGADVHEDNDRALRVAAIKGHTQTVALLLDHGANLHAEGGAALLNAAINGCIDTARLLLGRSAEARAEVKHAFAFAVGWGQTDITAMFLEYGDLDRKTRSAVLGNALAQDHIETASLLLDHGANKKILTEDQAQSVAAYRHAVTRWKNTVRMVPPAGLWTCDPAAFKPALFAQIKKSIETEGYRGATANIYAYNAAALFQSEERVLAYLKKWGENVVGRQPLHDIIHMAELPKDLSTAQLSDWGDAVLKHGPQMAKLVKFCDRLPSPVKSADGKSWSYTATRAAVARFAFNHAAEHPALAALCMEHAVDEYEFDTALTLTKIAKEKSNIPEITIDGARFGLEGAVFKKLANDDVRGLFLGELTDCCQSIGKAGSKCAMHGFASENGGFYAIENVRGEIIGQSWAWRGTDGEMCFDSLETLGNRVTAEQWKQLLDETAKELAARRDHGVTALHVGTGGATPDSIGRQFASHAAKPVDYEGYRDSEKQIRVWKR